MTVLATTEEGTTSLEVGTVTAGRGTTETMIDITTKMESGISTTSLDMKIMNPTTQMKTNIMRKKMRRRSSCLKSRQSSFSRSRPIADKVCPFLRYCILRVILLGCRDQAGLY